MLTLTSVRKRVVLPDLAVQLALAAGTLFTFGWLLVQDQVHPIMVYCLELYLTF